MPCVPALRRNLLQNPRCRRVLGVAVSALSVVLLFVAPASRAIEYVVDSTVDAPDLDPGDGLCRASIGPQSTGCTLRAAIQQANAAPAEYIITLPVGIFVLTLDPAAGDSGGDLDVLVSLTIQGAGFRDTAIDANGIDRVFDLGANIDVNLRDLTIRNGRAENGAGINSMANLTLERVVVSDNHVDPVGGDEGGGIEALGTLVVMDSTIENNSGTQGGGIYAGDLEMTRTRVVDNRAIDAGDLTPSGAGIYVTRTATISQSLIARNESQQYGGGIFVERQLTLTTSTVSGNTAVSEGGGIYHIGSSALLDSVTIADNSASSGGGLAGTQSIDAFQALIAGNSPDNCATTMLVLSIGFNLEDTDSCALGASSDLTNANPALGPLSNNGGLWVTGVPLATHTLEPGSDAIDAGESTTTGDFASCTKPDQRGHPRPSDADRDQIPRCDIGAVEIGLRLDVNSTNDGTLADPADGVCETGTGNGICTLRAAIQQANAWPGIDLVLLPAGIHAVTLGGADNDDAGTGDLDILESIRIVGSGAEATIVDGQLLDDRLIEVDPQENGVRAELSGLTLRGGSTVDGGAISNRGVLRMADASVADGTALGFGGGLYNIGDAALLRVSLTGNQADDGAAIFAEGGSTTTLLDSLFYDNVATASAGGINNNGTLLIRGTTFDHNTATNAQGGALLNNVAAVGVVVDSTFSGNDAAGFGGAIRNSGPLEVSASTIADNIAGVEGGGIYNDDDAKLWNTIVSGNAGGNCGPAASIGSGGHNLEDANTCDFADPTDLPSGDPLLAPLADNGGPTPTRSPGLAGDAVDSGGDVGCPSTDQRGEIRPHDGDGVGGARCDVGAVERVPEPAAGVLLWVALLTLALRARRRSDPVAGYLGASRARAVRPRRPTSAGHPTGE